MNTPRPSTDFRIRQRRNRRMTVLLVTATFVLLALVSALVALAIGGGLILALIAVVLSGGLAWSGYRSSMSIALRATRAQPADRTVHRQLFNVVEEMSIAAGVPMPAVYVVDDPAPNAFATGRDERSAAIAVTTGLLATMDRDELTGVVAHEMAHIRNLDIRVMTVAVATVGAIAILADVFWRLMHLGGPRARSSSRRNGGGGGAQALIMLIAFVVVVVLAPIGAALLKAAVSRSRERLADATAVEFTRHPASLRSALEKLAGNQSVVQHTSHATSHLWIESPDDRQRGHRGTSVNRLFDTHPPLAERIAALREMEGLPAWGPPAPPS